MVQKRGLLLLVLSFFLVILASSFVQAADVAGCFFYPDASPDLYCKTSTLKSAAQADCPSGNCDINQWFKAGANCAQIEQCEEVLCSVDCEVRPAGKCTQVGGVAIKDAAEEATYCTPGCCILDLPGGSNQCLYMNFLQSCQETGKKVGDASPQFQNPLGMTPSTCAQNSAGYPRNISASHS